MSEGNQADQIEADWALYRDLHAPADARRAAAERLATATGDALCPHYLLASLGPCSLCEEERRDTDRERLEAKVAELQAENDRLRPEAEKVPSLERENRELRDLVHGLEEALHEIQRGKARS